MSSAIPHDFEPEYTEEELAGHSSENEVSDEYQCVEDFAHVKTAQLWL